MDHTNNTMSSSQVEVNKMPNSTLNIRFEDIISFFQKHLFTLLVIGFISGILGYAYSYTFPIKYESKITMLPEYGGARKSSFAMLAVGINSEGAEKLLPELYPVILNSSLFGMYLLKQPVTDQAEHSYKSLDVFLKRDTTQSFLSGLFNTSPKKISKKPVKLSDPDILSLSLSESQSISYAISLITATIDQKAGLITLSAETEDPFVSSILVEAAKKYLINYVEEYRTAKALQQVDFLKGQVAAAKTRFNRAEISLQSYRDRNRNPFLNVARIEEQRLQSEYVLAQSLHDDLVRRFEQALIKVKEEKPVFKILEPVKVPLVKSGPKRVRFFFICAFLGGIICLAYILLFKKNISKPIIHLPSRRK